MAEVITQSKTVNIRINGQVLVTPDPSGLGLDALDQVTVKTNVPDEHMVTSKTVTENGTYDAPTGTAYDKIVVNVDGNLEEIDIVSNGTYVPGEGVDGYKKVVVDVPSDVNNQDKTVTENGVVTADLGYSGLGQVTVNVEPTEEQKDEYRQEGADAQKAKLVTLDITENGVYTKEDGYSRVTVDVKASEEELAQAKAEQLADDKAAVAEASPITANGSKEILGEIIEVNVPSDPDELQAKYDEGEADGKASQLADDKAAISAVSPIVENGIKTILDTEITVNVPSDPEEIAAAKEEGRIEGEASGIVEGRTEAANAVAQSLSQISPITQNGSYNVKVDAAGTIKSFSVNVEGGDVPDNYYRIPYSKPSSGNAALLNYPFEDNATVEIIANPTISNGVILNPAATTNPINLSIPENYTIGGTNLHLYDFNGYVTDNSAVVHTIKNSQPFIPTLNIYKTTYGYPSRFKVDRPTENFEIVYNDYYTAMTGVPSVFTNLSNSSIGTINYNCKAPTTGAFYLIIAFANFNIELNEGEYTIATSSGTTTPSNRGKNIKINSLYDTSIARLGYQGPNYPLKCDSILGGDNVKVSYVNLQYIDRLEGFDYSICTDVVGPGATVTYIKSLPNLGEGFTAAKTVDFSAATSLEMSCLDGIIASLADVSGKSFACTFKTNAAQKEYLSEATKEILASKGWVLA